MNLKQIRTMFVDKNGRLDLVIDDVDYADNGADFFIKAGQRLLDSIVPYRKELSRYVASISANQASLLLKYVRSIDSVYVKESGSERFSLSRKSYSWLIEEHGEDFGEKAKGLLTFTQNPGDSKTVGIGSETYTFKNSPSASKDVQIGSATTDSIDNLMSKINTQSSIANAYKHSSSELLVEYKDVGTAGNSISFSTTVTGASVDANTLGNAVAGRANQVDTGEPAYWAPIISTPHPELTMSSLTSEDTLNLLFDLDRFSRDGIVWMPPADQAYTMTIYLYSFSKLENDADISYHSDMYPELLIMAANLTLEAFYRNTQGIQDWYNAMQFWFKGIDHDLVRAEMALSGNQLRG